MTSELVELLEAIREDLVESGRKTSKGTEFRVKLKSGKPGWVRLYDMGDAGQGASIFDHTGKKLVTTDRFKDPGNLDKELRKHLKKWDRK